MPEITAEGPLVIEFARDAQFDCDGVSCSLHSSQRVVHHAVIAPP